MRSVVSVSLVNENRRRFSWLGVVQPPSSILATQVFLSSATYTSTSNEQVLQRGYNKAASAMYHPDYSVLQYSQRHISEITVLSSTSAHDFYILLSSLFPLYALPVYLASAARIHHSRLGSKRSIPLYDTSSAFFACDRDYCLS